MSDDPTPPTLLDPLPNVLKLNSLNLLAGASGIGKTALLSWIVRQFETGQPIFGHLVNTPPAIGLLSADRSLDENGHWFDLAGVTTLRRFSLVDDDVALPNQRLKHLRVDFFKALVTKMNLPPGSLLIVDPIALFLGGNLLDYDTVAFACIEIQRWIRHPSRRYCIIGICHSSKQKADKGDRYLRLQDRISGTMAQLGYTSTQMFLASPEETGDEDGLYTFMWNPHTAPGELFQFPKGSNGLFLTDHAQSRTETNDEGPAPLTEFDVTLLSLFTADRPTLSTHELVSLTADGQAATRRKVFRSLDRLIRFGFLTKDKHGVYTRTAKPLLALLAAASEGGESPDE